MSFSAKTVTLVPLPFLYCEQIGVRDETITYAALLDPYLHAGCYDIRFFVSQNPPVMACTVAYTKRRVRPVCP